MGGLGNGLTDMQQKEDLLGVAFFLEHPRVYTE